jgi:hypothetical protein
MIEINIVIKYTFDQVKTICLREQPPSDTHNMRNDDNYDIYLGYGKKKKKSNKCRVH